MRVELAYGRTGLTVDLPDDSTTVVEPSYVPGLPDEPGALTVALRNPIGTPPLRRMVRPRQTVAISVCDITRPMPSSRVLPAVLRELAHVPNENIVILIAAGTHRANTPEELDGMLGPEVTANYRVVNHDAFAEENLEHCGETPDGIPVWLNRHWLAADFRITTGFVEPHFFAGFSGGPKMVAPGLAGFETTMRLHDAGMIGHPSAVWGVTEGNPIHDAIRSIAAATGVGLQHRRDDQPRPPDHQRLCGRALRRPRRRLPGRHASFDAPGPGALRPRDHDQQRLPARHEPVPVGQGHVGGCPGRTQGRHHRLRGRVQRRRT